MLDNSLDEFVNALEDSTKQLLYKILNTCIVGKITAIEDYELKKVTVKPDIIRVFEDGKELEYPEIKGVPLMMPGVKNVIIKYPKKELIGSPVLLLFAQRSIDNWLSTGELNKVTDNKKFDLSDCIAITGLNDFKNKHTKITDDDNFSIIYGSGSFVIEENGRINLNNGNFTVDA